MENTQQSEASAAEVDERYPNTPIGIVRSRDAFLRALPELLANPKYDRWSVAYCGDERIALAESQIDVMRECERRGLHQDTFFVGCIYPHCLEAEEEMESFFDAPQDIDEMETDATLDGPEEKS